MTQTQPSGNWANDVANASFDRRTAQGHLDTLTARVAARLARGETAGQVNTTRIAELTAEIAECTARLNHGYQQTSGHLGEGPVA